MTTAFVSEKMIFSSHAHIQLWRSVSAVSLRPSPEALSFKAYISLSLPTEFMIALYICAHVALMCYYSLLFDLALSFLPYRLPRETADRTPHLSVAPPAPAPLPTALEAPRCPAPPRNERPRSCACGHDGVPLRRFHQVSPFTGDYAPATQGCPGLSLSGRC